MSHHTNVIRVYKAFWNRFQNALYTGSRALCCRVGDLQGASLDGDVGRLVVLRQCVVSARLSSRAPSCFDLDPVPTHDGNAFFAH